MHVASPLGRRAGGLGAAALVFATLISSGTPALGAPEDPEAATGAAKSVLMTRPDGTLDRSLHALPADGSGWAGEAVQPWDVSRYLAHQKSQALEVQRSLAEGALREYPTPNQSRYDQTYFDLVFDIDPTVPTITAATTTMRAIIVDGPLTEMELDFADNMTISSLTVGGANAAYSRAGGILTVTLDRAYANGEEVEIVVDYSGRPTGGAFFFDSYAGTPMVWTLSQPYGGRTWWPSKDYPYDKPDSVDIRVTAPAGNRIVSNGKLVSETDDGSVTTAHWSERYPIATYLVHLGIYPYAVTNDTYTTLGGETMDLVFYDFPGQVGNNAPANALVDDMLAAYEDLFGEYPYPTEKYGHNESLFGGGMEHQTCTSLGAYFESIVAHEATHQWWGDLVTCATYNHVWLNEGFATYGEALWFEAAYGPEAYLADILANQYFGPGTIYVDDLNDTGRIFSSNLSYNKGSWVLHMLRGVIGDADFFQTLTEYRDAFAYASATTEDFQAVAEQVSGMDLDAFFQQWIYGEGYPIYAYDWSATSALAAWDVTLNVEQLHNGQLFTMPIEIVVETASGPETFVVQNDQASQQFVLQTQDEPLSVAFDPDNWILRQVLAPIPEPSFTREILLVNGVDWDTYGAEIVNAYEAKAFWGDYGIEFWDFFDEPAGGYPSTLPPARGHGSVPGDVLGEYEHVIWVGNNFNGDLSGWFDTPIYGYLQAGGNVLLLSRFGDQFLNEVFQDYLGVDLLGTGTIYDCVAVEPGFTDITRTGQQSFTSTFDLSVGANTTLLYKVVGGYNPNRGIGAVVEPPLGGEFDPDGGRFAFLSGRPYRWDATDLRANVERILTQYFDKAPADTQGTEPAISFGLDPVGPNPFTDEATLRFGIPMSGPARIDVLDVNGRRIRTLFEGPIEAGRHQKTWDGRGADGERVPSGLYFLRLEQGDRSAEVKVLRVG